MDHTYTTIRVAVLATGKEVISAVADKLGTTDELLLVHLTCAGGKKTDYFRCERTFLHFDYQSLQWLFVSCL